MTPTEFVSALANVRMTSVFNPYSDVCPYYDLDDAPARRRSNLEGHLQASLDLGVDTLWMARDLGYRGGRRTGIALTDEANLDNLSRSFHERLPVVRATKGPPVAERTAAVVWGVVEQLNTPVFTWNVFPFHPHEENEPLTNRCHTRAERLACRWLLLALLDLLRPKKIVAIGNDAALGLEDLGVDCLKVRHPSYGGITDFRRGIWAIYGVDSPAAIGIHSPQLF